MALNVVGGRFIIRKSNENGKKPTVSSYDTHTSGKWIDTDIYEAELYINTHDNKMWFRNDNNQIIEIPTLDYDTLKIKNKNLPDMFGRLNYLGTWALDTIPPIEKTQNGDYYIINKNLFINGVEYIIGDFIVYNGNYWEKIDNYKKKIYTTDIIYNNNTNLNELLDKLINKYNFNNGIITNKLSIIDNINIFNVDIDEITYKNNIIYHKGNSNNIETDWVCNNLISNILNSDNIKSNIINTKEITTTDIVSKNIVSKNIKTDTLFVNNGQIIFDNNSILFNGKGLIFNHLKKPILQYKSFDNYITTYKKIKYDTDKIFDDDLEIINKKYVDTKINNTQDIDINELLYNKIIIYKDIKYINVDVNIDGEFELYLDNIESNNYSSLITICVDSNNNNNFNILVKSFSNLIFNINSIGLVSLYFNNKNKKWYKN